ncbi:hypothetical protein GCM10022402_36890 [Salinactinospora qingdaonensis]|uniref:ER-bound oxygenase mpaB/mpaB'/Rubber oxygenase catalytic domain-containing protein n=1 Tax=Salinactinospora qingdaonensis TaxID=702744 RepID=A0ABP7G3N5_9ACTN
MTDVPAPDSISENRCFQICGRCAVEVQAPAHADEMVIGASLLAGAANVIMQLSHPAVGYGVVESTVESGQLFRHPVKRTRTTLTYLVVAMLGTDEERKLFNARSTARTPRCAPARRTRCPTTPSTANCNCGSRTGACNCTGATDT